ncbi:MAG: hypothetical protein R3F29_04230 [Planctomycetota bacterium]
MRIVPVLRSLLHAAWPVAVAIGAWVTLPPWLAVTTYSTAMIALAATGCAVLRTSAVQRITWRNHVAGWCLPYAQAMGGGTLTRVAASSLLGSAVVGGAVLGLLALRAGDAPPSWPLLAAWLLNVLSLLFLVATRTRRYVRGAPGTRRGRWLLVLVLSQLAASVALHLVGWPGTAALAACLPQLLLLLRTILVLAAMLMAGRNARWN